MPVVSRSEGRRQSIRLTPESAEAWAAFCAANDVNLTVMIEVLGLWLQNEASDRTVRTVVSLGQKEAARRTTEGLAKRAATLDARNA